MTTPTYMIIRFDEAAKMVGKGRSTLWNEIKEGRFPKPISLGSRSSGFLDSEVQAMIAARAMGFDDTQIKTLISNLIEKRKERASQLLEAVAA